MDSILGAGRWMLYTRIAIPLPFALWGGSVTMQHYFGSSDNFFDGKFITTKDPDNLAEFYQAEDLLRIIAIIPFFFNMFMNKVVPDEAEPQEDTALLSLEETHFNVRKFGMEVSFEIIQQEEEIDGETMVTSFQRHERFIDWMPLINEMGFKQLLWDQTWTYGFKRLEDGRFEVYHHGEKFVGPWPIRLIVFFHQYYVLWACKKYINGDAFGSEDLDAQQEQLACLPLNVFREFIGKIQSEKERALQALKDEPKPDMAAIAETEKAVEKLKKLSESDKSTISVATRSGATGSVAVQKAVKMIAGDADTHLALTAALTDETGKIDKAVNDAVKEVMKNPELEFKERPRLTKKATDLKQPIAQPIEALT